MPAVDARAGLPASVEVEGLSVYTHHGVSDAEQEIGQRLVLDISIALADCPATRSDRLEDTVDYSAVCALAAEVAASERRHTLERVAAEVAERLLERFPAADAVRVRATKPEPPIPLSVGAVAVEVELARERGEAP